jgi:adenylate cyclase
MKDKRFILAPPGALFLSCLLFLTSLDNKIFDLFLRVLPSLTEDESVTVLTLDDASLEYGGGFPFPRDVMADVIVFLREMGVGAIVFDLSYLDPSPERLNRDYAEDVFSRYLDEGFGRINETADAVIDGFASGALRAGDREIIRKEFRETNAEVRRELELSMNYLTRDVDGYFGQAVGFTGNTWLTLTMIGREDLLGEGSEITLDEETADFLRERIALKDIDADNDTLTAEQAGVMPAIPKLLRRARGAGFVNASPDRDGFRRRINLLVKYRGDYYGHLSLAALREGLGNPAIRVSDKSITLLNALARGEKRDIVIPRTEDGSVLIKWPKKTFYDYRVKSLLEFIQYVQIEKVFAENLALMDSSGVFSWWDGGETPWELFSTAERVKTALFDGDDSGFTIDDWLALRGDYIRAAGEFLDGSYEKAVLREAGNDAGLADYVSRLFRACGEQYSRMTEIRQSAAALKDHFCVIGADATSMTDYGLTVFEEDYPNVGTYAVMANMILSGEFLDDAPRWVSLAAALLLSFAVSLMIKKLGAGKAMTAGFLSLVLITAGFLAYFYLRGQYAALAVPFASTALTFLSLQGMNFFITSREKAFLHSAFSRYLAPEVINELIADPSKLNLGGENRNMSAIFTDLQGFSTISEQLDPAQLVSLLNIYLTEMSTIVMENRGTIDKYEGDAIVAFFGAPLYREDHAVLACRSAIRMKQAEKELNKRLREERRSPSPLFTRIGINTGNMVVGNMGAANKMDYTIMGNTVNLAARLEGVNKQYRTGGILISEYTKNSIGEEFLCRTLDRVRVVGIKTPVRLYELLGLREETAAGQLEAAAAWEEAIAFYEWRDFKKAGRIFDMLAKGYAEDKTAELYRGRCLGFLKTPPPDDWDGVNNLTAK